MKMDLLFGAIARPKQDPSAAGAIIAKWEFTEEELKRAPSIMGGISYTEEQHLIRCGATFIRKIADRLNDVQKEAPKITQLCVSVSIIQLRRFFTIQSLRHFDARDVGAAILFMTTKSEECPRRLEYVIRAWYRIRYESDQKTTEPNEQVVINKEAYEKFCEYITWLENLVLQTIGFNFSVKVPHPFIMEMASKFKPVDKKFQESVFWLVTDVIHLTNWTLIYKAPTIAVVCFYMAIIWKDQTPKFPPNNKDGSPWYNRLDPTITMKDIQDLTRDFLAIWKDVDKMTNLSMSQFDHKSMPAIMNAVAFPHPQQQYENGNVLSRPPPPPF